MESPNALDGKVQDLRLSDRTARALAEARIRTLRELVAETGEDLLHYKNFGRKSLVEVRDVLAELGLTLADDRPTAG
ncbi:MAG: DNA-directed RNA polymerase subunit alpha C-terminal domain-containing protein [Myxococcota bacterium]